MLKDGEQFKLAKTKLKMPVLVLVGSESDVGDRLLNGVQAVAENVHGDVIEKSGHWLAEEQLEALSQKLLSFFE